MKIKVTKETKFLCCCSWGQVRSVGTRSYMLNKGYTNVLACGLDINSLPTLKMLEEWADFILVCGEKNLMDKARQVFQKPVVHIDVGCDGYGRYDHPSLKAIARLKVKEKFDI